MRHETETMVCRRSILKSIGTLALAAASARLPAHIVASRDSRVILNEGFNWLDRAAARTMIDRVAAAGFNALITCVWHGSGATWPSKVAPMLENYPGSDPFSYLLELAKNRDIEVHAWFTVALRQRQFLQQFCDFGAPADKFEIHRPAFREFIAETIREFVARYPVHGVTLDYVRAGGISLSSFAMRDYSERTGRSLLTDRALATPEAQAAIGSWQESAITEVVSNVSSESRRLRPGICISVAAAPWYAPYRLEGQNSVRWADEGLVDVLYSMNYQDHLDIEGLSAIRRSMKHPALIPIVSNYVDSRGKVVSRSPDGLVALVRQAWIVSQDNGVAVYLYNMLSDKQIQSLSKSVFAERAQTA